MCLFIKKKRKKGWFRKLKSELKEYQVIRSVQLFGKFTFKYLTDDPDFESLGVTVLAKNPKQAAYRAMRKGYGRDSCNMNPSSRNWARWAIKLKSKPNNHRYVYYYD